MKPLYSLLLVISILLTACSKEPDKDSANTVVAKLAIKINDAIPANVTKIRFTDSKQNTYTEKIITSSDIGIKGLELELNYYKIPDLFNGQLRFYHTDALRFLLASY